MVLNDIGVNARAMTGYQAGIKTIGHHLRAELLKSIQKHLIKHSPTKDVLVVAGFQGINDAFELTTLGRGGSDTTAVAILQVIKFHVKYTDVDGVYATDLEY